MQEDAMKTERTGDRVKSLAGRYTGMIWVKWALIALNPSTLADVKSLAASALTQAPDRKSSG
jgi:hypothetical protein